MRRFVSHQGAVTLLMSLVLLMITSLIVLYAGLYSVLNTKSISNSLKESQAFYAAVGGLEYGLVFLNSNYATVTANPVAGFINYGAANASLTNVTFTNNARFSVVYTNPTANNYNLILITSTGVSDDGTAVTVASQRVYAGISALNDAITTQGNVVTSGNVTITSGGIRAGGTVTQSGNVNIPSVVQNDTNLRNMTAAALFSSIFGMTQAQMQSQSNYYANTSGLNYSTLTGRNWINSSVVIAGNHVVGSPSNPVLLVINGNLVASGTITIYGLVYVTGSTTMSGNAFFNGGVVSQGAVTMSGSVGAYNSSMISGFTARSYAKILGSWRDF